MRVLVCGSRHFNDYELLEDVLKQYDIRRIIHGAARGADSMAARYGEEHGITVEAYPANWAEHGGAAGPIRNVAMLKGGNPDMVVAFLAPNSKGTKHMIEISQKAGIPVEIVNIE